MFKCLIMFKSYAHWSRSNFFAKVLAAVPTYLKGEIQVQTFAGNIIVLWIVDTLSRASDTRSTG